MRSSDFLRFRVALCLGVAMVFLLATTGASLARQTLSERKGLRMDPSKGPVTPENFICGTVRPEEFQQEFQDAIAAGEIPDPRTEPAPTVHGVLYRDATKTNDLTNGDLFLYPDQAGLLLTNFSSSALFNLMTDAANDLIAQHGDQFDYIAFWLNYTAHHTIGAAFYLGIENDVSGIGLGLYDYHSSYGLGDSTKTNTEGYVMMWNVNSWEPGTLQNAKFTRLVLGQEFEHRFACFIAPITDEQRTMQGIDDGLCGRSYHWNFRVDGQGSGMEIADWTGSNPAFRFGGTLEFNTDIGGVFSYPDLYLMGYVSPSEMDNLSAELRYMDNNSSCNSEYTGPIYNWTSADVVAANGTRLPNSTDAQKHYKTGWIMFYLPAGSPTQMQIDRALGIMEQHETDWGFGTIGRGTMDNRIAAGYFSGTPTMGEGPANVQFTYDGIYTPTSYKWYFGDGDSADVQNPAHDYAPGLYDVELTIGTQHDARNDIKRNYITRWADTVHTPDTNVAFDAGDFYWTIYGRNAVPLKEIVIPVTLTNVPGVVILDSIVTTGCRTGYFESVTFPYDNSPIGKLAIRMRADNGGGALPLPPGDGPIARIWLHTSPTAFEGQTIDISVAQLSSQTFRTVTLTTTLVPVFNAGTITLGLPCDCSCHHDPVCDGQTDVLDVVAVVGEAFRNGPPLFDEPCPQLSRNDVNCDCAVDVLDAVAAVDVAFRAANPAVKFCNGCISTCL